MLRSLLKPRYRAWIRVDKTPNWLRQCATVTMESIRGRLECMLADPNVLWVVQGLDPMLPNVGDNVQLLGDSPGQVLNVTVKRVSKEDERVSYWPYRTLTVSPDVLMVLVPADLAPEFTRGIARRYRCEFGKVKGRLPLAVGNIFFPQHLPMFSVLDAAWRMVDNFRRLQNMPRFVQTPLRTTNLHLSLGNGQRNNFHPYAVLAPPSEGTSPLSSAFRTVAGWIAPMHDLPEGSPVLERPNVYDGFVLGGSGDRLNMNITAKLEGEGLPIDVEKIAEELFQRSADQPVGLMLLDEFETMIELWEELRKARVGDGPMRNLWFALESRRASWQAARPGEARDALAAMGQVLGKHYCGSRWSDTLESGLKSGLLQKTLQLHWSILKCGLDAAEAKEGKHDESI